MRGTQPRIQPLRRAWSNRSLRRLCLALGGFRLAELGAWIALTAYAYEAGGVREASALLVVQLVPATGFALVVGTLIRRFGASQVLRWGLAAQSATMLLTALLLHQGDNAGCVRRGRRGRRGRDHDPPIPIRVDAELGRRSGRAHRGERVRGRAVVGSRTRRTGARGDHHDRDRHVGRVRRARGRRGRVDCRGVAAPPRLGGSRRGSGIADRGGCARRHANEDRV